MAKHDLFNWRLHCILSKYIFEGRGLCQHLSRFTCCLFVLSRLQTSSSVIKEISEWIYYPEQDLDILFFFNMPMTIVRPYLLLIIIFKLLQHEKHTWFPDCTSDLFQSTAVCLMKACGLFPFPWNYKKKKRRGKGGGRPQIRKEFANLNFDYGTV